MSEKLQFDLDVGTNNLKKALGEALDQVKKFESDKGIGSVTSGLGEATKATEGFGVAASVAIGGLFVSATLSALNAVKSFAAGSVDAYAEQETAINRLNAALESSGKFTDATSQSLQNFASNLQKTTRFSDDATLGALGLLQSLTRLDAEGLQRAGTGAADLAARFGKDLPQVVETLGRAFNGQTKGLREFGIQFKDTGDKAKNFEGIMALVEKRFGGSAQKDLETYAGKQANLANRFNELQEAIGKFAVDSGALGFFKNVLATGVDKATSAMERLALQFAKTEDVDTYGKKIKFLASDLALLEQQRNIPGSENDPIIKARINNINKEIEALDVLAQKQFQREAVKNQNQAAALAPSSDPVDQAIIDKKVATNNALNAIQDEQIVIESERQAQLEIMQIADQDERALAEIEFIEQQAIARAALKLEKQEEENALLASAEERRSANKKANAEYELALVQASAQKEIAAKKAVVTWETQTNQQRVAMTQQTLGLISGLTASSNKTLFAIGKAAAISNATISGIEGVQKTLAYYPAPFGFPLAALVGAASAVNIAKIASTQPPAFADGGIVPGSSTSGDRVIARVNSGELILNQAQQDRVAGQLGGGSNAPIIIQIDGRNIAYAIRDQVQAGFKLS